MGNLHSGVPEAEGEEEGDGYGSDTEYQDAHHEIMEPEPPREEAAVGRTATRGEGAILIVKTGSSFEL